MFTLMTARPPAPPSDPLARWLRDPFGAERQWLHRFANMVGSLAHQAVPVLVVTVALVVGYLVLARERHRRWSRKSRWIAIAVPVDVDPNGGRALWRILAPLLTAQRTLLGRRPPVAFEAWADATGLRLGIWISPTLSVTAVARAISTAWPGAVATRAGTPTLPSGRRVSGGQVRLARAEWMPLIDDAGTSAGDPIRGLLAALATQSRDDAATVQILARPASSRRVARLRRAARALRRGESASRTARVFDLSSARPRSTTGTATTDPVLLADVREISTKAGEGPHFQVAIRYAVTGLSGWSARRHRRARIREISASFGLYAARNRLVGHYMFRPASRLALHRMHRGFVLSADELAALAHLPANATGYGLPAAPARAIAPPPQVAHG